MFVGRKSKLSVANLAWLLSESKRQRRWGYGDNLKYYEDTEP